MNLAVNPEAYRNEINQFFDIEKPVPSVFKNGQALREEYFKRESFLKKISDCPSCDILHFRAFFITKLLDNLTEKEANF